MPSIEPDEMYQATPLRGWKGRFFHTQSMTFAHYDLAADAAPLHEHHHPQEEVWNIVSGEILLIIGGIELKLGPGSVAAIAPNTPHAARPLGACSAIIVDSPRRAHLPGVPADAVVPDLALPRLQ